MRQEKRALPNSFLPPLVELLALLLHRSSWRSSRTYNSGGETRACEGSLCERSSWRWCSRRSSCCPWWRRTRRFLSLSLRASASSFRCMWERWQRGDLVDEGKLDRWRTGRFIVGASWIPRPVPWLGQAGVVKAKWLGLARESLDARDKGALQPMEGQRGQARR